MAAILAACSATPSAQPIRPAQTILIVDDHRAVREELAFALGYDGWQTLEAGSGPAAIEQVAACKEIALVLLDVKLPGLDGLEVLKQLKEMRPDLPVVMISGHGTVETAVQAVKRGAEVHPSPAADFALEANDLLVVLGRLDAAEQVTD